MIHYSTCPEYLTEIFTRMRPEVASFVAQTWVFGDIYDRIDYWSAAWANSAVKTHTFHACPEYSHTFTRKELGQMIERVEMAIEEDAKLSTIKG